MTGTSHTSLLPRAELLDLVSEASRAPSAHNTQPARFRHTAPGEVEIHLDPTRLLPVIDPRGTDALLGLGAACEGLSIALSRRGMRVSSVTRDDMDPAMTRAAVVRFEPGAVTDELAPVVFQRATWRGVFGRPDPGAIEMLAARLDGRSALVASDPASVALAAGLIDTASVATGLGNEAWAETRRWLRLSRSHPDWARDGLNAESLALSSFEAFGARLLMRPGTLSVVRALGLARFVVSEAAQVQSAAALVVLLAGADEDSFAVGRRFYRTWLEVTARGLSACPMSALVEFAPAEAALRRHLKIPNDLRLVNILRVGGSKAVSLRLAPRLPADELVLS